MERRRFTTLVVGSVGAATAGCVSLQEPAGNDPSDSTTTTPPTTPDDPTTEPPADRITNPSFEDGLEGWTVDVDLPPEPGEDSGKVDYQVEVRSAHASDGQHGLFCFIDGIADDGTVWVEQELDFTDVDEILVDVYSEKKSFNILSEVAFFAGGKPDDGLVERQFNRDEDVQDHEGWKTYQYDVGETTGSGTLAVGMNVIWETGVSAVFDNVRVVSADE